MEVLTPDFGKVQKASKMASSERVLSMKSFRLPSGITVVESDPFYGYESETVVAHLTKLNDIATLFTNDEKSCYYYILKIFPY